MKITGARILIESLIANGVDTIFGYPGGAILNIYDELYRYKKQIRHILTSHEQHAAHAADGYARRTGRAGVCLATSGPGATNLVTGIATAFVDSVPLVAITGNVGIPLLGKDSFQEVDIAGITMPIVKHNWIVEDVNDIARIVNEAFIVACSGRPGPVLIDIPKDVSGAVYDGGEVKLSADFRELSRKDKREEEVLSALIRVNPRTRILDKTQHVSFNDADIDNAISLINNSKRPMILAGGGVNNSGAGAQLLELAQTLNAPVALSLMGMGAFPSGHRLCTGLIGMHGTVASNTAVQECDLLLALGTRFTDRVTDSITAGCRFAKNAKIIHIDIDPAEINKNIQAETFIVGDLKTVLNKLIKKTNARNSDIWNDEVDKWKAQTVKTAGASGILNPRFVIQETAKALGENTVVVTDVGQHQMWAAQYFPFKNARSFLSSGGMGTMGYGMGAAIGAVCGAAEGEKIPVALFTGDGSFRMNCSEMATLVKYKLPVLIIIFNNNTLGMLRQWQNYLYASKYYETDLDRGPDFLKLTDAYGLSGFRATDEKSFLDALKKSVKIIASGKPALIEAVINKDEKVIPMNLLSNTKLFRC